METMENLTDLIWNDEVATCSAGAGYGEAMAQKCMVCFCDAIIINPVSPPDVPEPSAAICMD